MNNILTLNDIATKLARETNVSFEEALQSIEDLLNQTRETIISTQESVTFPGLGELSAVDNNLVFTPDLELAETVNEPFAFFEPVPYSPEIETDKLPIPSPDTKEVSKEQSLPEGESKHEVPVDIIENPLETKDEQSTFKNEPQEIAIEETTKIEETPFKLSTESLQKTENLSNENSYTTKKGFNPLVAFILGVLTGMIIVCIAVYFLYPNPYEAEKYIFEESTEEINENTDNMIPENAILNNVLSDSLLNDNDSFVDSLSLDNNTVISAQTMKKIEQSIVTDTVSATNFLATMSRKHYGRMEFWVYIYLENKDKLQNPDNVSPGTVVVIPPRTKYDIDPDSQESIDRAKSKTAEIYEPYR